jgi:hypothetical protein
MEMLIPFFFLTWIALAIFVGVAASSKGRGGVGWFLFAVIFSPLLGILFLMAFATKEYKYAIKYRSGLWTHWITEKAGFLPWHTQIKIFDTRSEAEAASVVLQSKKANAGFRFDVVRTRNR